MTPTSARLLAALAVLGAAAGWGVSRVWEALVGRYLPVPWSVAAALGLLAAALLIWALLLRPRLRRAPGAAPIEPIVAARTAALAMASSRTGAIVGGVYAGIGLSFLGLWAQEAGRSRVLTCLFTVLAAAAVVAVSLWIERMLRLPDEPDVGSDDVTATG